MSGTASDLLMNTNDKAPEQALMVGAVEGACRDDLGQGVVTAGAVQLLPEVEY